MMFDVMFQGYLLLFLVSPAFSVSPSLSLSVLVICLLFFFVHFFSHVSLWFYFQVLFCSLLYENLTWLVLSATDCFHTFFPPLYAHKILWLLQFYFFWDFVYLACLSSLLLALFFQKPYHRELERNYNIFPLIHNTANNSFLLPGSSVFNIFCPV